MRKEIVRVSPLRYAIILAAIAFALSLAMVIAALLFGGLGMMGMGPPGPDGVPGTGMRPGPAALFASVVSQTVGGFVAGLLIAGLYNLVAGVTGGVVIDLRDAP